LIRQTNSISRRLFPFSAVHASSIGQRTDYSAEADKANDGDFFFFPGYTVEHFDQDLKQINCNAELLSEAVRLLSLVRHQHRQVSDPSASAHEEHAPKRLVSLLHFELDLMD
jgi:hypothetical protein